MANQYGIQVLKDTEDRAVIKLTAAFDGTGQESNVARITANTLAYTLATNGYPVANSSGGAANTALPFYGLSLIRLTYNVNFGTTGYVSLFFNGPDGSSTAGRGNILNLSYYGEYGESQSHPPISSGYLLANGTPSIAGVTGDIGIATVGALANTSYSMVLEFRKNNAQYSRGQFKDPASFNYPPYGLKP